MNRIDRCKRIIVGVGIGVLSACMLTGCRNSKKSAGSSEEDFLQETYVSEKNTSEENMEKNIESSNETEESTIAEITVDEKKNIESPEKLEEITEVKEEEKKDIESIERIEESKDTEDLKKLEEDDSEEKKAEDAESAEEDKEVEDAAEPTEDKEATEEKTVVEKVIEWNEEWEFAEFSMIHGDSVVLYQVSEDAKTIAVNAGHGTSGGASVQTLCHPDSSAKVTGGSTASGATYATAVSGGTTMLDGTAEAVVNLKLAQLVKEKLLENGFNVCMIRDSEDVQLDNIARTVIANENADCHIALHYDSTENDKGFFYIGVPDVASYKAMEPVASHWQDHEKLGRSLLEGMRKSGVKIYGEGTIALDLTQTSYSKVPSVDLEVGDRGSKYDEMILEQIADGVVEGLLKFWE